MKTISSYEWVVVSDNLIISRGNTPLQAIVKCKTWSVEVVETETSFEYYTKSRYFKDKYLIVTTEKDVDIHRALEMKELHEIAIAHNTALLVLGS